MASSDSQINKPQCGHPERAELLDVNINTGAQSIDTESLFNEYENALLIWMVKSTSSSHAHACAQCRSKL